MKDVYSQPTTEQESYRSKRQSRSVVADRLYTRLLMFQETGFAASIVAWLVNSTKAADLSLVRGFSFLTWIFAEMTEPLSPDRLDLLLPALAHLAAIVRANGSARRSDLELLLAGSGLDEAWAVAELERWVRVLSAASKSPDSTTRDVAQRSLLLRGIPEAQSLLAIAAVAGPTLGTSHKLSCEPEQLDFGTLASGQPAIGELHIDGGWARSLLRATI